MGYLNETFGRRLALALSLLGALAGVLIAVLPGSNAAAASSARARIGSAPVAPLKSTVLGALPGSTKLHVAIALKPADASGLSSLATAVATPGSAQYRQYLSVGQFRQRFGASAATLSAVRSALSADGLTLSRTSANGLSFNASGTAADFDRAFATTIDQLRLPGGRRAYSNVTALTLPATLGSSVQAVLGLSDVFQAHPLGLLHRAKHTEPAAASSAVAPDASTGQTDPALTDCSGADADATANPTTAPTSFTPPLDDDSWTGQDFAQAYDFDPAYAAGDQGQNVTVGIFELEGNFPADITAFEKCYGISTSVSYVPEDGGPATPSASDSDGEETELDIENVAELAPQATIKVYQSPNTNDGLYDNYSAMVTNPVIKVISSSWGECEAEETAGTATAESTLFQEGAAQGISMTAAAGDSGAEDCAVAVGPIGLPVGDEPTAAVDDPASQPFVTGVGGTDLEDLGAPPTTKPTEAVWNDGTALVLATQGGAGGGGVSELWPMPAYQTGAAKALNVINSESSATTCGALAGDCREVPDVTANAGLYTAYIIYYNGAWTEVGGTSGAAPLWAAVFAEADANATCQANGSVGFANPDLYTVAGSSTSAYAADFNDVTSGDNDALSTNGGDFTAGTGYDMASGLGSPVVASLAPALCNLVTAPASTSTTSTTTTTTATQTTTVPVPVVVTKTVPSPTKTVTRTKTVTKAVCRVPAELSFVQHPAYPVRATKVLVYINGKLVKTVRGKRIVDVLLKRPKATKFKLKLIVTLSTDGVITHQSTYNGCKVSRVVTKLVHKPV
jgi:subtilase family serine protease